MQLKLQRTQRTGGVLSATQIFCLDARIELTAQERADVTKYKLGKQILYSSEAAKRYAEKGMAQNDVGSALHSNKLMLKSIVSFALARLALNITVDSLQRGQHIECKDLDEVLDAEDALMTACKNLRGYLDTAVTFDGREAVIDFNQSEPTIVSGSTPVQMISPPQLVAAPVQLVIAAPIPPSQTMPPPSPVPTEAYEFAAPTSSGDSAAQSTNPFMPFWQSRTDQQKLALMIGGAIIALYLIVHFA